ncbi:MAG TPA: M23 family metallopeptidase [Clostridia bacterium]|nr:M23 family metallopeptidase [Clostridia bacterium]
MKQRMLSLFAAVKTGTAKFLRAKGIYVVIMTCVAAVGLAAALLIPWGGGGELPEASDPGSAVGKSEDESLTLLKTPAPTPTPSPTPIPDFTQAPATSAPTNKPLWSPPVRGEIIWGYAIDQLIYSRTLKQWMTHAGVDVASPKGTEVYAVFGGTVEAIYTDDMLGVCVEITGDNGFSALYANLKEEPPIHEGDALSKGALVGYVGDTAVSECGDKSHVHFELRKDDTCVDPTKYVKFIKE